CSIAYAFLICASLTPALVLGNDGNASAERSVPICICFLRDCARRESMVSSIVEREMIEVSVANTGAFAGTVWRNAARKRVRSLSYAAKVACNWLSYASAFACVPLCKNAVRAELKYAASRKNPIG